MSNFVPTSRKRLAAFRGPTESTDFNSLVSESYADVTRLYNLLKDLDETMREYFSYYIKENAILHKKIEQLEQDVEDLETSESGTIYARFYSDVNLQNETLGPETIDASRRLDVDTTHGLLTLPVAGQFNNLVTSDSLGLTIVPPTLAYNISSNYPSGVQTEDGNFYNCLSSAPNAIWERLALSSTIPDVYSELDVWVRVPIEISSNPDSNCLILHMFPSYFVDLMGASYSIQESSTANIGDGEFLSWEHYFTGITELEESKKWVPPDEEDDQTAVLNCRPLRFDFDPQAITAIHLKLRQRNWLNEDDMYVIPFGISYLSLVNNRYSDYGSKVVKIPAPTGELFFQITDLDFLIYNHSEEDKGNNAAYRLFYKEEITETYVEISLGEYIEGGTTDVYVEVTLYKTAGNGTPALTGVKLSYLALE